MKIAEGFALKTIADNNVVVPTGTNTVSFRSIISLNETGAFIWNMLTSGDVTKEDMVAKMTAEYDISAEIALKDIEIFVENLAKNGILE